MFKKEGLGAIPKALIEVSSINLAYSRFKLLIPGKPLWVSSWKGKQPRHVERCRADFRGLV